MATKSRAVTVGTEATRLDTAATAETGGFAAGSLAIYNAGATTVYLGGADVTIANGYPVAAAGYGPGIDLATQEAIYGIVEAGTAEVRVIETGI